MITNCEVYLGLDDNHIAMFTLHTPHSCGANLIHSCSTDLINSAGALYDTHKISDLITLLRYVGR